ncbi:uncharacterized protein LOC129002693 [Macrosteles quadrilineatus]|uniref:uncharacterized protein LOC129002693 n=1 Tax=Macrosteles quadrilineatus TaxID=74068 RepID=UPI0023E29632|nr:uncharacterized protein LOC129002693 [Macrosteles quadrilineatus]
MRRTKNTREERGAAWSAGVAEQLRLTVAWCLLAVTHARPEPPIFTDDYNDNNFHGGNTVVLLGGNGHGGGGYDGNFGGNFGGHTGGGGGGGYEQSPVIQKHIYVHIPPPEREQSAPQKVIPPPPPKKHYKIVFIKAPSVPAQQAPVIPAPQQDQEKTLIYVLHKHPADSPAIVIPTPAPTTPSKPEVYFIRYKTQKELSPSSTVGPHYSSTFGPVSSTHGHLGSTAVSIVPRPSPSYSTTASYH